MRGRNGFTLIEVMVTVAIVAILAAIAYPSYTAYIVRSNRAAAQGYMLEVTNLQQRYLLDARQYASDSVRQANWPTPANVSPNYTIAIALQAGPPPGYTITATPINAQQSRDTACGTLTVDQTGQKTVSGTGTSCW
ncbi:type IV pilus assembly protein PilE [Variovorax sp. HW608]|uniref:type IV pilin protein n=1 Tax=Variovorax sp. HW608 TaxID=1034889 RepID=UPI00081FDC6D|nr:type IV pilin protein [Variovorax sp. HW608]SCK60274.1 type IV pilus assembly protein PilE [Variovorax sp. HW608]